MILGCDNDEEGNPQRLRRVLLKVINNELTPRQKEIIMLYYFKDVDIVSISKRLGVSPQAVSTVMSRARMRMFRILQYYI
jgi:RNA polymerase sigma-70 factor (ECF subfamily)